MENVYSGTQKTGDFQVIYKFGDWQCRYCGQFYNLHKDPQVICRLLGLGNCSAECNGESEER